MKPPSLHTWISGVLLGFALMFAVLQQSSSAPSACDPFQPGNPCSQSSTYVLAGGSIGPAAGRAASSSNAADYPTVPTAGGLVYDDFVQVEQQARMLLKANIELRKDISPYQTERPEFEQLVRRFNFLAGVDQGDRIDIEAGFSNGTWDDPTTAPEEKIIDRLARAEKELLQAGKLYGFLAVYADTDRFRADDVQRSNQEKYKSELCANAENPNPVDPTKPGIVKDPIIDWCDFPARLRQSVREAAYLRMIFGQQFTANALGVNFFSAGMIGGESMVRKEISWLAGAVLQYDMAEASVSSGLRETLGNGCRVSDFYTQAEWALLSRAAEGKELAQHHIAVRRSYLDITSQPEVVQAAQTEAQDLLRVTSIEQYVQAISAAGLNASPVPERCKVAGTEQPTRPDGDMVAKMVTGMLDTRQKSREMREGRNIFGYDVRFTPAHPLHSRTMPNGETLQGLYEMAKERADTAAGYQELTYNQNRSWEQSQEKLLETISSIKSTYDLRLADLTGCDTRQPDSAFFECVNRTVSILGGCLVQWPQDWPEDTYRACAAQRPSGQLRAAVDAMRTAYLGVSRAKRLLDDIPAKVDNERWRNVKLVGSILGAASDIGINQYVTDLLSSESFGTSQSWSCGSTGCSSTVGISVSSNPNQPEIARLRSQNALRQAAKDVEIVGIDEEQKVRDLLIEEADLEIALQIAIQEFNAQGTQFQTLASEIKNLAIEARRARAYLMISPANDPSYRLVLDSARIELASKLEEAARVSYLAARRAEYEHAYNLSLAALSDCHFRMSDIYRARTAQDTINFLQNLDCATRLLPSGDTEVQTHKEDFTISVAQNILGLTDEYLGLTGEAARMERIRRFREWVVQHTYMDPSISPKPILKFRFSTSLSEKGILSNVMGSAIRFMWLQKLAGVGRPRTDNSGFGIKLLSDQTDARQRYALVTQGGLLNMRGVTGCVFDYRLIPPSEFLGLIPTHGDPSDLVRATFKAGVGTQPGEPTSLFLGRAISASDWEVTILSEPPQNDWPLMDFQKLTDIQLLVSTTRASSTPAANPPPEDCVRLDF